MVNITNSKNNYNPNTGYNKDVKNNPDDFVYIDAAGFRIYQDLGNRFTRCPTGQGRGQGESITPKPDGMGAYHLTD